VRTYYYADGARVAMREGSTLYYILADHLGSTAITANSDGTSEVGELRYYAYGKTRYTSGTTPTNRRFTGQIEDATIGLYFYNARYYDPALGRFIAADTMVPEPGNPQDLNRYSYVRNNALRYVDPSGHMIGPLPEFEFDISGWNKWAVVALRAGLTVMGAQTNVEGDVLRAVPSLTPPCGADFVIAPGVLGVSGLADVTGDAAAQIVDDVAAQMADDVVAQVADDAAQGLAGRAPGATGKCEYNLQHRLSTTTIM
jgi:RHS repeat-associated protein